MHNVCSLFICTLLFFIPFYHGLFEKVQASTEDSYCVMSMKDTTILDKKNENNRQSVASISKIMTAIIVIENGNLNDWVEVDDSVNQVEGSSLYLQKGEKYTVLELVYGLMLRSGNDAALLLANHVGKDVSHFVDMMNQKAKQIGMNQSVFHNPSGLDEEDGGNISTSCDMALLMRYAMQNKTFQMITKAKEFRCQNGRYMKNKNRFLNEYSYATGGKTGYTKKARRTLVTTSKKENMEVVVVTLRVSDDFAFHQQLHEAAYSKYKTVTIIEKGDYRIANHTYHIANDILITIHKQEEDKVHVTCKIVKNKLHVKVKYHQWERDYTYE